MKQVLTVTSKTIVALAATWAVGVSLYIFFAPINTSGVRSVLLPHTGETIESFTQQLSWYEAQGVWGVLVLAIFSAFYLIAFRFAWRGNGMALVIMAVVAIALSVIAGFSIGMAYMPAALALFLAALLLLSSNLAGN